MPANRTHTHKAHRTFVAASFWQGSSGQPAANAHPDREQPAISRSGFKLVQVNKTPCGRGLKNLQQLKALQRLNNLKLDKQYALHCFLEQ
jgi:hypothetical protein